LNWANNLESIQLCCKSREGSSRSRVASELAEMFARADGETEALPDKGPDAAARSALEFLRRLTESLGLVE